MCAALNALTESRLDSALAMSAEPVCDAIIHYTKLVNIAVCLIDDRVFDMSLTLRQAEWP